MTAQPNPVTPVSGGVARLGTWAGPAHARHIGKPVTVLDSCAHPDYEYATRQVCVRLPGGAVVVASARNLFIEVTP